MADEIRTRQGSERRIASRADARSLGGVDVRDHQRRAACG